MLVHGKLISIVSYKHLFTMKQVEPKKIVAMRILRNNFKIHSFQSDEMARI